MPTINILNIISFMVFIKVRHTAVYALLRCKYKKVAVKLENLSIIFCILFTE